MLKITVKGQELTLDEARALYHDLGKLFGPQPEKNGSLTDWLEKESDLQRRIQDLEDGRTRVIGPGSGYGPHIGGGRPWFGVVPPLDPFRPVTITSGSATGAAGVSQN